MATEQRRDSAIDLEEDVETKSLEKRLIDCIKDNTTSIEDKQSYIKGLIYEEPKEFEKVYNELNKEEKRKLTIDIYPSIGQEQKEAVRKSIEQRLKDCIANKEKTELQKENEIKAIIKENNPWEVEVVYNKLNDGEKIKLIREIYPSFEQELNNKRIQQNQVRKEQQNQMQKEQQNKEQQRMKEHEGLVKRDVGERPMEKLEEYIFNENKRDIEIFIKTEPLKFKKAVENLSEDKKSYLKEIYSNLDKTMKDIGDNSLKESSMVQEIDNILKVGIQDREKQKQLMADFFRKYDEDAFIKMKNNKDGENYNKLNDFSLDLLYTDWKSKNKEEQDKKISEVIKEFEGLKESPNEKGVRDIYEKYSGSIITKAIIEMMNTGKNRGPIASIERNLKQEENLAWDLKMLSKSDSKDGLRNIFSKHLDIVDNNSYNRLNKSEKDTIDKYYKEWREEVVSLEASVTNILIKIGGKDQSKDIKDLFKGVSSDVVKYVVENEFKKDQKVQDIYKEWSVEKEAAAKEAAAKEAAEKAAKEAAEKEAAAKEAAAKEAAEKEAAAKEAAKKIPSVELHMAEPKLSGQQNKEINKKATNKWQKKAMIFEKKMETEKEMKDIFDKVLVDKDFGVQAGDRVNIYPKGKEGGYRVEVVKLDGNCISCDYSMDKERIDSPVLGGKAKKIKGNIYVTNEKGEVCNAKKEVKGFFRRRTSYTPQEKVNFEGNKSLANDLVAALESRHGYAFGRPVDEHGKVINKSSDQNKDFQVAKRMINAIGSKGNLEKGKKIEQKIEKDFNENAVFYKQLESNFKKLGADALYKDMNKIDVSKLNKENKDFQKGVGIILGSQNTQMLKDLYGALKGQGKMAEAKYIEDEVKRLGKHETVNRDISKESVQPKTTEIRNNESKQVQKSESITSLDDLEEGTVVDVSKAEGAVKKSKSKADKTIEEANKRAEKVIGSLNKGSREGNRITSGFKKIMNKNKDKSVGEKER